jgi:ATP-dependent helicase/nuclease subunit A
LIKLLKTMKNRFWSGVMSTNPINSSHNPVLPLLSDATARAAALDPHRSVIVTAPAGSGKTELLTRRILILLAQADEPEDILAITFTRKAAAEMRERLLKNLRAIASDDCAGLQPEVVEMARAVLARDQEKNWQLLLNPQRLRVQTIDSFTGSLIAHLPLQSGFGGRPSMREDADNLHREAVRQLLQSLETDSDIAEALGVLLQHVDNRFLNLEQLLIDLLAKRDQWLLLLGIGADVEQARNYLQDTLQELIEDHLQQLVILLQPLAGELMSLVDYACQQLRQLDPGANLLKLHDVNSLPEASAACLEQWRLLYQFLFTQSGELRKEKGITKRNGFPTDKKDVPDVALAKSRKQAMAALLTEISFRNELIESLKLIDCLPDARFSDSQWKILSALVTLLPRLLAELQLVFARRGEVDFTEQSLAALRAIGNADDSTELRYSVDQRLKHILVDEFQDTSVVQYRLLQSLVAEWDWHNQENPHAPRTLFIVGDGMQSIYGFRAADVGLFLDARRQGIGPVQLDARDLTVNFRSSPAIVDWVNQVFSKLFPVEDDPDLGTSHHVHAEAIKNNEGYVSLRGFIDDEKHQAETDYCLETIQSLRGQYPDQSIAILVRAKLHLHALIELLIQENIPWQAADIAPLVGRPVVQDLWMLLRALANPADRIAWLALLRSPLCGLNNADLFTLLASSPVIHHDEEDQSSRSQKLPPVPQQLLNRDVIQSLSTEGCQLAGRLADVMQLAEYSRERKPLRVWLESIWLGLGGARAYENRNAGENPWDEAEAFFDLVENNLPYLTDFDAPVFEEILEKLFVKPAADNNRSVVHLMTMHKAKGLEFDSVILPYLDRISRSDEKPLLMWDSYHSDSEPKLLLAVKPARGGETDSVYDYLLYKRVRRNALEQVRLLYVAATRAKSRLYLCYGGKRNGKGELLDPPSGSLLAKLLPAFQDSSLNDAWQNSWQDANVVTAGYPSDRAERLEKNSLTDSSNLLRQLQPGWRMIDADVQLHTGEIPQFQETRLARAVGVVVHKVLEVAGKKSVGFWQSMTNQQQTQYLTRLLEQYLPVSLIDEAVTRIQHQLSAIFADAKALWMLDSSHQQAKVEWQLFSLTSVAPESQRDEMSQSIIDRCFIADNVCWLIDYKTAEPMPDESVEIFIAREKDIYLQQLQRYAKMLSDIWNLPVKVVLYFTAIPYWYEL